MALSVHTVHYYSIAPENQQIKNIFILLQKNDNSLDSLGFASRLRSPKIYKNIPI